MTWAWTDPIDAATDLQDVSLWNKLLRAVHERYLACGAAWSTSEVLTVDAAPPTLTPGKPNKWVVGDADTSDPLKGALLGQVVGSDTVVWIRRSVFEMQFALSQSVSRFINHVAYPTTVEGLGYHTYGGNGYTVPFDLYWNGNLAAEQLGYPSGQDLWRRKQPRRIYSLTATTNEDFQQASSGIGGPKWVRQTWGTLVAGDRAQYYDAAGVTSSTLRVPGTYRGIYQYQGSGAWAPAAPGVEADTLDSNNGTTNRNGCSPGYFAPGDYFGHWLLKDVQEVCKLLKWTFHGGVPRSTDGTIAAYDYKEGNASGSDEASTKAAVEAAFAAATPSRINSTGVGRVASYITDFNFGRLESVAFGIAVSVNSLYGVYQGLPRSVEYLGFGVPSGAFDAFVSPFTNQSWAKARTEAKAAGAHAMGADPSALIANFEQPTWGPVESVFTATGRGWAINPQNTIASVTNYNLALVAKWVFTDA